MTSRTGGQPMSATDETELRYLIERLLARTSLASEGQDERLDALVSELRQYLRGRDRDLDILRDFQERLDDELERLDDQVAGDARQAGRILGELLSAVEGNDLFQMVGSDLKRLRKKLGPRGLSRQQLIPWLEGFCAATEKALAHPTPGNGRERGLLDRLFKRGDEAVVDTGPDRHKPKAEDEGHELDTGADDPLTTVLGDGEQRLRIARRVGELMERIMQQVDLPPDTHKRAVLLRSRLSDLHDWDMLRQSLDETADLVIAVVTHSQREFQSFLQRLDERLSSLHGHLSDHADVIEGRRTSAAELERALRAELSELGGSLETSSDLSELRTSVSGHIERIARTVEAFRTQEDRREQQVSEQMMLMREKVVAMETHCDQVREQLERERARALTDILTQLPNREAWDERLRFEHQRWQRYGRPVTLAMIDIDYFKRVNDSFGHKAGDRVLQLVAKAIQERLRSTDFLARYGGEEFVAILPETSPEQAAGMLDEIRRHVADMPFHFQGQPVRVTVSSGFSGFRENVEPDLIFDEADKALYQAKTHGRNRVEYAGELEL
ncbi:diguanylate cyclase [Marinobacter sp. M1N3S26]|uniref:diguanylate cyclase n=1 Tax=Marinobacter sp. M1N3S26 TaxID=3382299 RepID=UPI00387AA0DA